VCRYAVPDNNERVTSLFSYITSPWTCLIEQCIRIIHPDQFKTKIFDMSTTVGVAIEVTKQSFECFFDYALPPAVRQTSVAATIHLRAIRKTAITAVVCLQQESDCGVNVQAAWNAGHTHQACLNLAISTNHRGTALDLRISGSTPARGAPRTLQGPESTRSRDNIKNTEAVKRVEEFHPKRSYVERSKPGRSAPGVAQRRPMIAGSPMKRARNK
jgi:hypothetical protein